MRKGLGAAARVIAAGSLLVVAAAGTALAQAGQTTKQDGKQDGSSARAATSVSAPGSAGETRRAVATGTRIEGDGERTRFRLELTRPVVAQIFVLGAPYRVVVDVADLEFKLPPSAGRSGHGLVSAFRYGLFAASKSRLVLDVTAPVLIENAAFVPAHQGNPAHLAFDLVRIDAAKFAALKQSGPQREGTLERPQPRAMPPAAKRATARPVIVIDPGHGGPDPGAVAGPDLLEKNVVLAVARQLKAILAAGRRYDVHLTRNEDVFVSLDERLRLSRQYGADLFISLHVDALAETDAARSVRGATIYTLSERASDETARRLAEKENASDLLAGLDAQPAAGEDDVRSILIDLIRRETANFSTQFRNLLTDRLKGRIALSREPHRSAAFKVLKQSETPCVLLELGYMSNAEDQARLRTPEWQRQVAQSVASAIDAYFAERLAGNQR
ncbi:MAG TPA: N-acetylmuramoyl-L-alanine amidase [Hyphomicrobiaceae bacterium]|nr:N-acetylmuramoyl-L-alanine amidase [Hyphomicrobiaceae bacterium]